MGLSIKRIFLFLGLATGLFGAAMAQEVVSLPKDGQDAACLYLNADRLTGTTTDINLSVDSEIKNLRDILCFSGVNTDSKFCDYRSKTHPNKSELILEIPNYLKYIKEVPGAVGQSIETKIWDRGSAVIDQQGWKNNLMRPFAKGELSDTCPVYLFTVTADGRAGTQQSMLNKRIDEACDGFVLLLKNFIENPIGTELFPNPSEASYIEKRANWCTKYVINPEIERIQNLIIQVDENGQPKSGINYELDKIRQASDYVALKKEHKNLEDLKNNMSNSDHSDFVKKEDIRKAKIKKANDRQKVIRKELENKELGLATALGEFNAYLGFLRNKAAALGYETLKIKTGSVNVGTLCVGAECGIEIFENPETGEESLINRIIGIFAGIAGTLGVLLLVVAGAMMVMSRGDEDMLSKAKKTFAMTIFGLVLVFSAYIIVQLVISVLFTLDA